MSRQHTDLSPQQKRQLLEDLLRRRVRDTSERRFPLSFAQEGMLLLEQLAPGGAYEIVAPVRIEGALDVGALREAVSSVVNRHESLRTTFPVIDGEWTQSVSDDVPAVFREVDVAQQGVPVDELLHLEVRRKYDLAAGPCFRTTLFRTAPEEHVFLMCMHHVVSDGWSIGILVRDLAAFYEAHVRRVTPSLAPLSIQYRDYAAWQRERMQGERLQDVVEYWRRQLENPPTLELPLDHPRPAINAHRGSLASRRFPSELIDRMGELSGSERVTPFMTLLAAFKTLLMRYSGQTDIAVGTPISGRTRAEVEDLIGLFMNTLVLRTDVSGNPRFREVLRRVRNVAVAAYDQQELPFAKLVAELRPERDLSRNPLFQTMFAFQRVATMTPNLVGLRVTPLQLDRQHAQLDLSLQIQKADDDYVGTIEYNADLFSHATIERMLGHFHNLLEDIAADPDRPIGDLQLMSESQRHRVLVEWNATERVYPRDQCFHRLFEAQVARSPDATAAQCGELGWTYGELNERANRIGHHLRELGVGRGDRVAIAVGRGLEMLAGLLGIMKAGAAYVPIDPSYPSARIAMMLEDCEANALCTANDNLPGIPDFEGPILCLDDEAMLEHAAVTDLPALAAPTDAAYVIYTSGSTGKPKGVQISGRSLVNFLSSMREEPGLSETDTLVAVTSISFDISCLELYLPLLAGARVVIARDEAIEDGYRLADLLQESRATVMQATPATWRLLANGGWQGKPDLKALCGGEAMTRELADFLLERTAEVWNLYGPTETTVWSTVQRIEGDGPITVGRPIANTSVFTVDKRGRPTAPGIPGEVWIGGDGVAIGYLHRPDLTAQRFVAGTGDLAMAGKLYRTGDLGRIDGDGRLEHLGRLDHQIKVRGFRVEPGEVETALVSHPSIAEAVVVARDSRLVAYVVHRPGPSPTVSELRDYLRDILPPHAVPSMFVALEALPLTPNAKVDRGALPDAFGRAAVVKREFVVPETDSERLIARIWGELLKLDRVSALDNFFDLGGHSLLAMQAVSKIESETGSRIDLRDVFFRNLRQLATAIG